MHWGNIIDSKTRFPALLEAIVALDANLTQILPVLLDGSSRLRLRLVLRTRTIRQIVSSDVARPASNY